jgi:hypothetical protein
MPTDIKLKNSVTATNAPTSLQQGEVAINITDKKVWVGNAATTPVQLLGAGASGTFGALTVTSLTDSGNLTFTGTGNRITGDFSNATASNRVAFQSSTTNGATTIEVIPNGTGTSAGLFLESDSTITNSSALGLSLVGGTDARIQSLIRGSGTFLPMTFYTGGAERLRIDTSGKVLIGTTAAASSELFRVNGSIATNGYFARGGISGSFSGNSFNINWVSPNAQLWIDSTNIGNITVTSDYRVKRNIETQTTPALERVMALRPVTYQMADYGGLFKAGEEIKEGFIAHEVQEVIPSGAEGVKDDETQIQSLRVDAILAVAVKAIQELKAELDSVKAELQTIKGA